MNTYAPELMLVLLFIIAVIGMYAMVKVGGKAGIITFGVLVIIISNIQVLKTAQFSFMSEPIALGTVLFSFTLLVTDLLTEIWGRSAALKFVKLSFGSALLFSALMLVTTWVQPLTNSSSEDAVFSLSVHNAMVVLFTPTVSVVIASMVSYIISQVNDIWIFSTLKRLTSDSYLWLRSGVSTLVSSFIDSLIFSFLAFYVFADTPLSVATIFWSYVVGTYGLRILMTLINIPILYGFRNVIANLTKKE